VILIILMMLSWAPMPTDHGCLWHPASCMAEYQDGHEFVWPDGPAPGED